MNNSFPFPKLLGFLKEEKDQVEFMKVAAEVGISNGDIELAKILLALQLYAAFYAKIPRQIKSVHDGALEEIRGLRDEVKLFSDRTAADAVEIGRWAESIKAAVTALSADGIAKTVQKRLVDETLATVGGSVQALVAAYGRMDTATQKLNDAAFQADLAIDVWQTLSLRRVWMSAFFVCLGVAFLTVAGVWFFYLRHQPWWLPLQSI